MSVGINQNILGQYFGKNAYQIKNDPLKIASDVKTTSVGDSSADGVKVEGFNAVSVEAKDQADIKNKSRSSMSQENTASLKNTDEAKEMLAQYQSQILEDAQGAINAQANASNVKTMQLISGVFG